MGIWREHFHPDVWLKWEVLGWIVATLIAVAAFLPFFDQFLGAEVCISLLAFVVSCKIIQIVLSASDSTIQRVLFTFVLFGLVGIALVESIRGINHWVANRNGEIAAEKSPAKGQESPNPKATPPNPHEQANEPKKSLRASKPEQKMPSQPPVIQMQPAYGNLAARCEELGNEIIAWMNSRMQMRPDPSNRIEYRSWYSTNDGYFHARIYPDVVKIQNDLAAVQIRDPQLDKLIEKHQYDFTSRNRDAESIQQASEFPEGFFLSPEELAQIGHRLKTIAATQIPH